MATSRNLNIRISELDLARLKQAAAADRLTVTAFVLRPALARADEILGKDTGEIHKDVPADKQVLVDTTIKPSQGLITAEPEPKAFWYDKLKAVAAEQGDEPESWKARVERLQLDLSDEDELEYQYNKWLLAQD